MYATGLKPSEIVKLKLSDLDLKMGYVICTGKNKSRLIPLGNSAISAVKAYIKAADEKNLELVYLFGKADGTPITRQGFWKIIKQCGEKAGLENVLTPTLIRQSFAAHMLQNGADFKSMQELMGYADISALDIYKNIDKKRIMDVYNSSHPRA